jgi:hypothetical protein
VRCGEGAGAGDGVGPKAYTATALLSLFILMCALTSNAICSSSTIREVRFNKQGKAAMFVSKSGSINRARKTGAYLQNALRKIVLQKLPSLSTTAQIRYIIDADCSDELWEGVLLRKIEQDHIPHY